MIDADLVALFIWVTLIAIALFVLVALMSREGKDDH